MAIIVLICASFLFMNRVQAELSGNCELEGAPPSWLGYYQNEAVDDNAKEFATIAASNITGVQVVTKGNYWKYFIISFDSDYVTITPSDLFAHFERSEVSEPGPFRMTVNFNFNCRDGGSGLLTFLQPINDLNTFKPEFDKESTTVKLPMPLSVDFDLGCFGFSMVVCDYDITNIDMTFEIDPPEEFSVRSGGTTDDKKKCHQVVLTTAKPLKLTENKNYKITATDVGNPSDQGQATVNIEIDKGRSFPANPQFKSTYYRATYYKNPRSGKHGISVHDPIYLKNGYYDVQIKLLGEYASKFSYKVEQDQIVVSLVEGLAEDVFKDNAFVLVTIEATLENAEGPGTAVLVVDLPKQTS